MSGGKGGSQSAQVQIPQYLEDAARQNIDRAQAIQNMPYAPIMGPTMAGFTSGQKAGMESQAALAQRMGIIPQSYDVASGYMPGEIDVGNGLTAYASYPGAKERVIAAFEESPQLARQYGSLMFEERPTYQQLREMDMDRNAPTNTLDVLTATPGRLTMGDEGGRVAPTATGQISDFERQALDVMRETPMGSIAAKGMTSRNDWQTDNGYNEDYGYGGYGD